MTAGEQEIRELIERWARAAATSMPSSRTRPRTS
jgi:hypothetical protein